MSINEKNVYAIFGRSTNNTIQRITNLISADTADTTSGPHPMTIPINNIFSESPDHFTTRNIDGNNDDNVSIIQCIHRINQLINDNIDRNTQILIPFEEFDRIITSIEHNEQEPMLFIYKLLQKFYLTILDIWINKLSSQTPNGNTANILELLRRENKKMKSGYYVEYYRYLIYKKGVTPSAKYSSVEARCNRIFKKRSMDRVQKETENKKIRTKMEMGYSDADDESNDCSGGGQSTSSVTYDTLKKQYSYDTWANYDSDQFSEYVSSSEDKEEDDDENEDEDEYKEKYGNYPDKNEFKFR